MYGYGGVRAWAVHGWGGVRAWAVHVGAVYEHGQCKVEAVYEHVHCTVGVVYEQGRWGGVRAHFGPTLKLLGRAFNFSSKSRPNLKNFR